MRRLKIITEEANSKYKELQELCDIWHKFESHRETTLNALDSAESFGFEANVPISTSSENQLSSDQPYQNEATSFTTPALHTALEGIQVSTF